MTEFVGIGPKLAAQHRLHSALEYVEYMSIGVVHPMQVTYNQTATAEIKDVIANDLRPNMERAIEEVWKDVFQDELPKNPFAERWGKFSPQLHLAP